MRRMLKHVPVLLSLLVPLRMAGAEPVEPQPSLSQLVYRGGDSLASYAFQQRLGAIVPVDTALRDETGAATTLRAAMGGRPTILDLGYYHCPNLCGTVRDDLFDALPKMQGAPPYRVVALSVDPAETPGDAASAKADDMTRYPMPDAAANWRFLTGGGAAVQAVESAVGFPSRWDPQLRQFLHPTGLVFLTPGGKISSYLLGVGYSPSDITDNIARAERGGVSAGVVPVLLLCFHFDPTTGRYDLSVFKALQVMGVLTVLTVGGVIGVALRREHRR